MGSSSQEVAVRCVTVQMTVGLTPLGGIVFPRRAEYIYQISPSQGQIMQLT